MESILDIPEDSYIEREVKKEIEKNQAKFDKSCSEIRSLVEDIGFYYDENKKLEKVGVSYQGLVRHCKQSKRGTPVHETLFPDIFTSKQNSS